jgi:hypothetical protein
VVTLDCDSAPALSRAANSTHACDRRHIGGNPSCRRVAVCCRSLTASPQRDRDNRAEADKCAGDTNQTRRMASRMCPSDSAAQGLDLQRNKGCDDRMANWDDLPAGRSTVGHTPRRSPLLFVLQPPVVPASPSNHKPRQLKPRRWSAVFLAAGYARAADVEAWRAIRRKPLLRASD